MLCVRWAGTMREYWAWVAVEPVVYDVVPVKRS